MTAYDPFELFLPSFTGNGSKVIALNAGATALEWVVMGGGGISDGDKGDITVSGSGAVWTIDNDVVTNAKAANMAADTIKGRANGAGTGDPQDLSATQVRTIINVASGAGISQLAATISDFASAALLAAPAETTTTVGALINGAASKATPVDADYLGLMDSAASNILKKTSWLNIKATLKTYFDTVYSPIGSPVADADYGDITVSSSGTVWTIDNSVITNAKRANMSADTISGRANGAGSGAPQDLTATQVRTIINVANGATANSSDATLLARANHTGTQLAATISDFNAAALLAAPAETTTTVGALINGAAAKTSLVNADMFAVMDSAASNIIKKFSWANLMTALDALYTLRANNLSDLASAPTARTNLGATTVGGNLFTLTNPSAIRFIRINADNTITARTAAELLTDIGAQASGTYLVAGNNLSDVSTPATARTNLGATTVGGNIFTLTNPGAITFIRVNADNSVTARSAANFRTDLGSTTVGDNLFTLTNPGAVRWLRVNADNTVSSRTAAETLADIGAQASGSYLTSANIVQTIRDGQTTTAPSEDVVSDYLLTKNSAASAEFSQVVVSGTAYYITRSDIAVPADVRNTQTFMWRLWMSKTAAGTGTFQIRIYRGTNASTADTADVTQTIGTQTAVVDSMVVDITLTITALGAGATDSYFWTICPMNKAATATGFGVATGTTGLFSGTVSSVDVQVASTKFGIGFIATTGTPTVRVVQILKSV